MSNFITVTSQRGKCLVRVDTVVGVKPMDHKEFPSLKHINAVLILDKSAVYYNGAAIFVEETVEEVQRILNGWSKF